MVVLPHSATNKLDMAATFLLVKVTVSNHCIIYLEEEREQKVSILVDNISYDRAKEQVCMLNHSAES